MIADYGNHLESQESFADWTLEEVCEVILQQTRMDWIVRFVDRYLNFDKLES